MTILDERPEQYVPNPRVVALLPSINRGDYIKWSEDEVATALSTLENAAVTAPPGAYNREVVALDRWLDVLRGKAPVDD